jgi:membrane protease YdiL (CAAX protease family)
MNGASDADLKRQKPDRSLLAPMWHTIVLILILLVVAVGGARLQSRQSTGVGIVQEHPAVLPLYLSLIAFEWLLVGFVWFGVRRGNGIRVRSLVGGKWANSSDILRDLGIAVAFWIVWMGVGASVKYMLGPSTAKSVDVLLPQGFVEIMTWVLLSISAGFCEEVVYRGYLQGQFLALTGSATIAIVIQGVLFGVTHGYQGMKLVITISVYGVLYGVLASWRKSLRPGMISHAWSDTFSGFLSKLF